MTVSTLRARLESLIASAAVRSPLDAALIAAVESAERLAARARAATAVRCARQEAAIRAEGGMLAPSMEIHRRVSIVRRGIANRLDAHDLAKVPSARVVRRYLRVIDDEKKMVVSSETTSERR